MKLYTEEAVKMAIKMADKYHYLLASEESDIVNSLTPIELPSEAICNHPLPYRLAKSDTNFVCTLCGKFI